MYWAICDIFMYNLVLLELWKMVCMLCFMGWCSFIVQYSSQLNLKYCISQKEILKMQLQTTVYGDIK